MTNVKIAGADKGNGRLLSVTLQILDENDIKIFKSLVNGEDSKCCKKCKEPYTTSTAYYIKIDSPLTPNAFGMKLGTPMTKCSACGEMNILSMVDYTPFQSVCIFLQKLRLEYNKRKRKG